MSGEKQLRLDLPHAPSFAAEDFLTSPSNARARAMIDSWPSWPARTMILQGPAGSGKSHLGSLWAARADATTIGPADVIDTEAMYAGSGLKPLQILLEDCDRSQHPEASIFHLINMMNETGGSLLITARSYPDRWPITTPDLISRLRLAPSVAIGAPDSALIRAVLVKLFADRQIRVDPDVISYAVLHGEQSLDAVSRFVAAVDDDALEKGRRITRPLAILTLNRLATMNGATDGNRSTL